MWPVNFFGIVLLSICTLRVSSPRLDTCPPPCWWSISSPENRKSFWQCGGPTKGNPCWPILQLLNIVQKAFHRPPSPRFEHLACKFVWRFRLRVKVEKIRRRSVKTHIPLNLVNSTHNKSVYVNFMPLRPLQELATVLLNMGLKLLKSSIMSRKKEPFSKHFLFRKKDDNTNKS